MSCATSIGSWPELVAWLDGDGAVARWAAREPELRELNSVGELARRTARADPRADAVLGALVRIAAADGGSDSDAVLVVLHLLWPGLRGLVRLVRTVEDNAEELVAGQAAIQIGAYPWRRRRRRYAANLLRDIHSAVARELRCDCRSPEPRDADVPLVDVIEWRAGLSLDDDDLDVYDVFTWARRTGVVAPEDVRLLLEIEHAAEFVSRPRDAVAARHGWTARTLDRHRHRALNSLRAAVPAYLAAVA